MARGEKTGNWSQVKGKEEPREKEKIISKTQGVIYWKVYNLC